MFQTAIHARRAKRGWQAFMVYEAAIEDTEGVTCLADAQAVIIVRTSIAVKPLVQQSHGVDDGAQGS